MRVLLILACMIAATGTAHAAPPPTIDGFVNDTFWAEAARTFLARSHRLPDHAARFHLGFDPDGLYLAADIDDTNVIGSHRLRPDEAWLDDAVELLIALPAGPTAPNDLTYCRFTFSAAGGIAWTRTRSLDGEGRPAFPWPPDWNTHVECAIALKPGSTLNFSGDRDRGFVTEARIPWPELGRTAPPAAHETFRVCFVDICRPELARNDDRPLSPVPDLALEDRQRPQHWPRITFDWHQPMPFRGSLQPLPAALGTDADHGDALDRPLWTRRLDDLDHAGFNRLVLHDAHPSAGLVRTTKYPDACPLKPEELARRQADFQWLLDQAATRNIAVYLMQPGIALPPAWAAAQGVDPAADTPAARDFTALGVESLFTTYPQLAGLGAMTGPSPASGEAFVREAIVRGLNAAAGSRGPKNPGHPELLLWTRYLAPEQASRIAEAYPHTTLVPDLQGEQWFMPSADPRVQRYQQAALAAASPQTEWTARVVPVGGPRGALTYLLWSDPLWMTTLATDLRRHGAAGFLLADTPLTGQVARQALGAGLARPAAGPAPGDPHGQLQQAYGLDEKHARLLLQAMQHASAVMPRFLHLVHSQSDRFMPQFGLPLTHYLYMPTLSSYVCEDGPDVSETGRLESHTGPTWPNPEWGEDIAGVVAFAENQAPLDATSPWRIGQDIRGHVDFCVDALRQLRQVEPRETSQAPSWTTLLDRIELNAMLGRHVERKIDAAIGWQKARRGRARRSDCTRPLEESVDAWKRVVELADRLHPEPVGYWQSRIETAPPWTQDQISASYQWVNGHWRDQLPRFARELERVEQTLRERDENAHPPLWSELNTPAR